VANVQTQFEQFNKTIKLERFKHNATLREKRDIIRGTLDDKLPAVFQRHGETCPKYHYSDQGSYKIGTGTKPLDGGEFDIDQGIYFQVGTDAYPDPVVLKKRVYEALDGHTDKVRIRKPCVTVTYHRNGEAAYHVDFAIYSDRSYHSDAIDRLARGITQSSPDDCFWEPSDQKGLYEAIKAKYPDDTDRHQFRCIVRAFKRWKDVQFPHGGQAAPRGIALTVAAYYCFQPTYLDKIARKTDDLSALRTFVRTLLGHFQWRLSTETLTMVRRLEVKLPVAPRDDLFARMTDTQMAAFEDKLSALQQVLDEAAAEVDPVTACEKLQKKAFGSDFPVPARSETGKSHGPAIVSSSNSA
jgi:hypothetical protein